MFPSKLKRKSEHVNKTKKKQETVRFMSRKYNADVLVQVNWIACLVIHL